MFAVLLALSPDTEQAVVDQVEACYDALKHPFGTGAVYPGAQPCAGAGGSAQEKRDKVLGVYQGLKAAGRKYGAGYELGTLGEACCCPLRWKNDSGCAGGRQFLSHQKGYRGGLGLPKNQRLMHSAMLVSGIMLTREKTSVMGPLRSAGPWR